MPKNEKYLPKCFVINSKSYTFAPLLRTMKAFGRLAQLVQSICLTSRGSAVRIRQRPQQKIKELQKNVAPFLLCKIDWLIHGLTENLNRDVNRELFMNVGISVICYKSKTLKNGEHPLMLRVCEDRF